MCDFPNRTTEFYFLVKYYISMKGNLSLRTKVVASDFLGNKLFSL